MKWISGDTKRQCDRALISPCNFGLMVSDLYEGRPSFFITYSAVFSGPIGILYNYELGERLEKQTALI